VSILIGLLGSAWAHRRLVGPLLLGLALIAAALWFIDAIGDRREAEVRQEIRHEDDKAAAAAAAARQRVRDCYARGELFRWNRATGQCVGLVPKPGG
jgi:hypothetical protein